MSAAVTVVVTCFNREAFLGPSIESVLASRYADIEVLVVDDASTDGSSQVARSYAARDPRVRVVVNETNLGDYKNRNAALERVRTPFVKYHDSDDLMYPHCLGVMIPLLEREPRAAFALSAGTGWSGGPAPMLVTPELAYAREFLGTGMFSCGPAGALFRTDVLKRLGGFPELGPASDYLFWLEACATENALLVPADLFWYRVHGGQEYQRPEAAKSYARAQAAAWRALLASNCPLSGESLSRARRRYAYQMLKVTLWDLRAGRWSLARFRLAEAGFRPWDWLRYPPLSVYDPEAGAPRDASGGVIVPEWLREARD